MDAFEECYFVPDYEPDTEEEPAVEEERIKGSCRIPGKGRPCPICQGKFTNVRRHVLTTHLPWYTAPLTACWECNIQFGQPRMLDVHFLNYHQQELNKPKFTEEKEIEWTQMMNGLIAKIGQQYGFIQPWNLFNYVNTNHVYSQCKGAVFQPTEIPLMKAFNRINRYETDVFHAVYPPNHIYSLLHWKILSLLIQHTENTENLLHYEQRLVVFKPEETVNLIDSHCHLDVFLKQGRFSALPLFAWKDDGLSHQIQYLVTNFCFPRHWPSSTERVNIREDPRIRMTFGIHPKVVGCVLEKNIQRWIHDLSTLADAKAVVAIGECGLDISCNPSADTIHAQIQVFEQQIQLAHRKQLPIVIHCRGKKQTYTLCLNTLVKILPDSHKIHVHCFNGDTEDYLIWKKAFPNSKFGISPFILNETKYPDFRATIGEMKLEDILVETDAPYLKKKGETRGTPLLVYDITLKLAAIFGLTVKEVAEITTSNSLQLYSIH